MAGRPTKYRRDFDDLLVEHMKKGLTMEAFAAIVGVSKQTVYTWLKRHRSFLDAKKRGEPYLELFYLQMGQKIAMGQVRRVVSEEPVLDGNGQPVMDPTNRKQVLMRREYAPAPANATAFIFLSKVVCKWQDRREINVGGQPGNPVHVAAPMTNEQRLAEIERLRQRRLACGDD